MLTKHKYCDVLLFQRTEINHYPPVINQANILAENDLKVVLIDGGSKSKVSPLHSQIFSVNAGKANGKNYLFKSEWYKRLSDNLHFISTVHRVVRNTKINAVIAYDSPAISLSRLISVADLSINHFHEHPEFADEYRKPKITLQHKLARSNARNADIVIIPDEHRANALVKEENLKSRPVIVKNCPRKIDILPKGKLKTHIHQLNPLFKTIVLFQGAISKNYYVDRIIESIRWWPEDSVMVYLGPHKGNILHELTELAIKNQVRNRVVFIPQVDYSQLFSYTIDADIGLSMIKPVTFNFTNMSGASNKRYEFMACGIPQISNWGPGQKELIEDHGVGFCVNPDNPEELGHKVTYLLENKALREKMSQQARRLHLAEYNYENQFRPVLDRILVTCKNR